MAFLEEGVWFQQAQYEEAEANYQLHLAGCLQPAASQPTSGSASKLVGEIAKARQNIQQSLESVGKGATSSVSSKAVDDLVKENKNLRELVEKLSASVASLTVRVDKLEGKPATTSTTAKADLAAKAEDHDDDDDDDFDLFGSDDEEEIAAAEKLKAERVATYYEKKAQKKKVIAKSSLLLDVKPWDDETDMAEVERLVRSIEMDGLLWGKTAKLVPLAYGIKKLQIPCVIEDDKVSTDDLEAKITAFEDLVQSMDIAAFNKV